jgi:hypothetical protein
MVFFLGSFVDSLLVFSSAGLPLGDLKGIVIVDLGHLVWVLEEVLLQVTQLLLYDGFSLVFVDFSD